LRQLREKAYPHLDGHALTAVEAFSTGRFQPLQENPKIWAMRMKDRCIGSEIEARYCDVTGQDGFAPFQVRKLRLSLTREIFARYLSDRLWKPVRARLRSFVRRLTPPREKVRSMLGERVYRLVRDARRRYLALKRADYRTNAERPLLLHAYRGHNIVKVVNAFYAVPRSVGNLDLETEQGRDHPALLVSDDYFALLKQLRHRPRSIVRMPHSWRSG
jgi:hypothetical protein